MVQTCVICEKQSVQKADFDPHEKVSFHRFPEDPKLYNLWEKHIRTMIPNFKVPNDGLVCSRHFKKEDFSMTGNTDCAQLRSDLPVVPSIFPLRKVELDEKLRPIMPKPTVVSLDDSVDIKDVFLTQHKKLEVGDKVLCRVGDKLVPGFVENVKSVKMAEAPGNADSAKSAKITGDKPGFFENVRSLKIIDAPNVLKNYKSVKIIGAGKRKIVDAQLYDDEFEEITVKSEVESDKEDSIFEPEEDEVSFERQVYKYNRFDSDMSDIPEYEVESSATESVNLTSFPKIKVVKNSDCNSVPQIRGLTMQSVDKYQIQNIAQPTVQTNSSKPISNVKYLPGAKSILRNNLFASQPCGTVQVPVNNSILRKPGNTLFASQPSGTVQVPVNNSILRKPGNTLYASQPSGTVQVPVNNSILRKPGNTLFASQPSGTVQEPSLNVQQPQSNPPSTTFFMLTPQSSTPQNTSNQLLGNTPAVNAPLIFLNPSITSSQKSVPSSLPQSLTTTPQVFLTSSFFSQPTPGVTAATIQSPLGIPCSPDISKVATGSSGNTATTSQTPSDDKETPSISSDGSSENTDKNNSTQQDDDQVQSENGLKVTNDDSSVITKTPARDAADLRKLRKILKERKGRMRAMEGRLKRREKRLKIVTEKLSKYTSSTPEQHAAEVLTQKFPTCIQHLMSRIATIASDKTDKKVFKYSDELKEFLVKLRYSNDAYNYLNSNLKNGLPGDDMLKEWANSLGSFV